MPVGLGGCPRGRGARGVSDPLRGGAGVTVTVPSGACLPRHTRAPVLLSLPQPPAHLAAEQGGSVGGGGGKGLGALPGLGSGGVTWLRCLS